jgi:hypothetical protein
MIGKGISSRSQYPYYQYKYNFCVVFDLITSTSDESFVLPKRGQVKLDSKLKSNVNSITCIALGQTDSIIQIGKDFEIYTDIIIISIMDDITLSCCLKHLIPTTSKVKYCKILAHDEVNQITYIKLDSAYIINTAKRSDARATLKHWCVAYITTTAQNMIEMLLLDPYGLNPVESYNFVPKIKCTVVSRYPLQPLDSSKCGLYCLYFIYKRSLGFNSDQMSLRYFVILWSLCSVIHSSKVQILKTSTRHQFQMVLHFQK